MALHRVLSLFLLAFSAYGCASINGSVPFRYVPSLTNAEPVEYRLGMQKLTDARPDEDRDSTESIADVEEKVTAKLLEDFRSSRIFLDVDFPASKSKDPVIMKGEVKRFYWKLSTSPLAFIPLVNLAIYFGAPVYDLEGTAAIHVQLIDSQSGRLLAEYEKESTRNSSSSIYNMKAGEVSAELAEAFRDVSKQIKEAIVADLQSGKLQVAAR